MELKTPISALQEYMVANKKVPRYELIHNGVGTHNPEFIYRVYANDSWVDGVGKSKREAKHRAAAKMLETLNLGSVKDIPLVDQFTVKGEMNSNENYVGHLKEHCLALPYPEPYYKVEEETGPPHCKIFKMVCFVSQLSEFGIAMTKKAAKQQAAYKMLERLKKLSESQIPDSNVTCDTSLAAPLPVTYTTIPKTRITQEEIVKKYVNLKSETNLPKKDRFVFYKDHERAYLGLPELSETLTQVLKNTCLVTTETALEFLKTIASDLEVDLTVTKNDSENDSDDSNENFCTIAISGSSDWPAIAGIGKNVQSASFNLLMSLITLCSNN